MQQTEFSRITCRCKPPIADITMHSLMLLSNLAVQGTIVRASRVQLVSVNQWHSCNHHWHSP
jgi:hypothetical protein